MNSKNPFEPKADLFELTTRPEPNLFYKSNDPHDKKLGDVVAHSYEDYEDSRFVILGCPQDEGVRRNNGRVGAAEAPDRIREAFYKISAPANLKAGQLFDTGNIQTGPTLEETHENQTRVVAQIISHGKIAIVLGGGNDIAYPDGKGLGQNHKKFLTLNIDSHFDVRENKQRNSGTPYRQLLEEKIISPENFFELASQPFANSEVYADYLKKKQVAVIPLEQLRKKGVEKSIKGILKLSKAPAIFWGIDMDSVRSADAPGVSASNPTGLTAEEILSIAAIAGNDKRSRILEISEVNPKYDIDGRTCKLAALIITNFLKAQS